MALEYFLYRTDFNNTLVDRSDTSFAPLSGNTGQIHIDGNIPETQPVYLWKEQSDSIIVNDEVNVQAWYSYAYPPEEGDPVYQEEYTGYTTANDIRVTNVETAIIGVDNDVTYVSGVTSGNTTNITTNASNIADNANDLTYLSGETSGNTVAISANAADVTYLSGATTANTVNIGSNQQDIGINKTNIESVSGQTTGNTVAISANAADVTYLSGATEGRVRWENVWEAGTYQANDMVRDGDWTMIANKETADFAAPQAVGEQQYLYYPNTPSGTSTNAKQITFGMQYSGDTAYWLTGYRINVVTGNHYEIITVEDPYGSAETSFVNSFTATITGWREFGLTPRAVRSGFTYQLLAIVHEPDPTPVTWVSDYDYMKPNNWQVPALGEIVHATKDVDTLSINEIDENSNDRSSLLAALNPGDFITVAGTRWAVQVVTDTTLGYFNVDVAPSRQASVSGVLEFSFETTVATTLSYGEDVNYWSGTTNVRGLLAIDESYTNVTASTNQYGVDILIQEAYMSPDWDFVTVQGNGGGSSGTIGKVAWGFIEGDIDNQLDLQNQFDTKLDITGFTAYTAVTETRIKGIEDDIVYLSGETASNDADIAYLSGETDVNSADIAYISGETASNDADIAYISGVTDTKIPQVPTAVVGNFAIFNDAGNVYDSGISIDEVTGGTGFYVYGDMDVPQTTTSLTPVLYVTTGATLNAGTFALDYNAVIGNSNKTKITYVEFWLDGAILGDVLSFSSPSNFGAIPMVFTKDLYLAAGAHTFSIYWYADTNIATISYGAIRVRLIN